MYFPPLLFIPAVSYLPVQSPTLSFLNAPGLVAPPELVADLAALAATAGLIPSASVWTETGSREWSKAWAAICQGGQGGQRACAGSLLLAGSSMIQLQLSYLILTFQSRIFWLYFSHLLGPPCQTKQQCGPASGPRGPGSAAEPAG